MSNEKGLFEISEESFRKSNLNGKYRLSWVEDSLDYEKDTSERLATPHTRSYLGTSIKNKKIFFFCLILGAGFLIVLGKIFYLQVIQGDHYRALAEQNRVRTLPVPAERGIIYDRFNKELVQNIPSFTLSIVPADLPREAIERENILNRVATISGVSIDDIRKNVAKFKSYGYQSLVIKENLDYQSALKLYIENADLPGILIQSSSKRYYPVTDSRSSSSTLSLSHILGYLSKINDQELAAHAGEGYQLSDSIGKTGLEKTYETELRGVYGTEKIEVDARGKERNVLSIDPPTPGKNITLTIDLEAQKVLEQALTDNLALVKKTKAAAIAMNPTTGEILAMVSWPAFDNNDFSGGISTEKYKKYSENTDLPLFNRALSGTYPPGSTIKLIVSAAALQEKIISLATAFDSTGGLHVGGHYFRDWKAGGHGITNVTKAIAWSVNTFFYYVGGGYGNFTGLGADTLLSYFSKFHLNEKSGIDLPGEKAGFLPSKDWKMQQYKEPWYVGDTYNISIGQGDILVSPLRVALWTAEVAMNGRIVTPHVVSAIIDPLTKKKEVPDFPISEQSGISDTNYTIVQQGMSDCVSYGSCQLLKNLGFSAGGKTGTAQWNANYDTHAWFTSFAPLKNPQIVVTVLVEAGGEGSRAAMPIADTFLRWWGKKYLTHE
jgi:penicillin-binding protein 2